MEKFLFIVLLSIALTGVMGCSGSDSDSDDSGGGYSVRYEVSTDEAELADISYVDEHGDTINLSNVNIKSAHWTYSFTAESGSELSLTAQIIDARATIRVTIFVNEEEFSSKLSWGDNVSATTSGTL